MTNHGDDCYFFYYSTCTKGDSCPFRHCEAAMGNETVCNLWQEGRCFRTVCKFRHMEITKNRKEIHCYWETQPAGCQKPHCAFFHEKARYIDGVFVPPNKGGNKVEEQLHEEPAPLPAAPLPTPANPQLRGVIKTEAQEPVPSPTHPPVVINPADDDEDEDDQFSEEGEDCKGGPSPRKIPKSGDSLNFGVSTLEEIRLRKALKASMKRAGYPIQSANTQANGEKENIQSLFSPALHQARDDSLSFDESRRPRGSVADRLGKRIIHSDGSGVDVPLKRSLAQRLGGVIDEIKPLMPPQKSLKPIQERLGFSDDSVAPSSPEVEESKKAPEQIRIKTLEEIRQERAAKSQSSKQKDDPLEINTSKNTKGMKQTITIKHNSMGHVKTFSEILRDKKKGREENEEQQEQKSSPKAAKHTVEKAPGKSQGESDAAEPCSEAGNVGRVRVKTLEEIRREKAARIQAQQAQQASEAEDGKSSNSENAPKKRRLLCLQKPAQTDSVSSEKICAETEKPLKGIAATPETNGNTVKVKTFEEIMREKRNRKQEVEEQAKGSTVEEPSQKQPVKATLKRTVPTKTSLTSADSPSPSSSTPSPDTTLPAQKLAVRKRILLKAKAASPVSSTTDTSGATLTSGPEIQSSPPSNAGPESCLERNGSSREVPDKNTNNSITLSPAKQARAAPQGTAAEAMTADTSTNKTQKKPSERTTDTKVRPKLNVKPSVMKPAVQVKPGLKRRGGERSAVAAVKPLNSTSPVLDESLQETTCRGRQVPPPSNAEAQLSSAVPCSPSTTLDLGPSSSPLREDLQTVPVFKQSLSQETKPTVSVAAARDPCTVPQSPVLKTPTQPKSRRLSAAASRSASTSNTAVSTSAVDDFEDLINEFTDDHLEEDMDPGIGEDDLLQELSEMIDS